MAADVPVLHAGFHDDEPTWSRANGRPWRPVAAESGDSPYAVKPQTDQAEGFAVVTLAGEDLVGEAVLWGIDVHNRTAHLGVELLSPWRGRGFGVDVVRVLCRYAFAVRGFHRLQIDTLADNEAMKAAADRVGFRLEGTLKGSAWLNGEFVDEVILGLLATEWS
jgi:RimJ/RimL family protein N-acetyltransferase